VIAGECGVLLDVHEGVSAPAGAANTQAELVARVAANPAPATQRRNPSTAMSHLLIRALLQRSKAVSASGDSRLCYNATSPTIPKTSMATSSDRRATRCWTGEKDYRAAKHVWHER
jgi:hypothetical protein